MSHQAFVSIESFDPSGVNFLGFKEHNENKGGSPVNYYVANFGYQGSRTIKILFRNAVCENGIKAFDGNGYTKKQLSCVFNVNDETHQMIRDKLEQLNSRIVDLLVEHSSECKILANKFQKLGGKDDFKKTLIMTQMISLYRYPKDKQSHGEIKDRSFYFNTAIQTFSKFYTLKNEPFPEKGFDNNRVTADLFVDFYNCYIGEQIKLRSSLSHGIILSVAPAKFGFDIESYTKQILSDRPDLMREQPVEIDMVQPAVDLNRPRIFNEEDDPESVVQQIVGSAGSD